MFRILSACQKSLFDKLVDGGASSPARCRASNLRFEPSAVSPRAKPENPKGFQPPCHPLQFLLESYGFRPQKLQRNGFCSGKLNFPPQKSSRPRRSRRRGTIVVREGFGSLALSRGFDRLRIRCFGSSLSVRRSCAERPEKRERRHEYHLRPFRETAFAHAVGKGISAPGKMGGSAALGALTSRMTKPHGVEKMGTRSCKKGFDLIKKGKEHIKQGMNHKAHFRRKRDAPG